MPTEPPTGEDFEAKAQAFAEAVNSFLKEDERTLEWLARKSGIASSTLRAQLLEKPSRLTYINSLRISRVVPVHPLEDVAA